MWGRFSRSVATVSLVFLSLAWFSPAGAAIKPVGQVILANGPFIAIQSDKSSRSLTRGSEFYLGDRLWTGPSTKAQVRFSDGAIMTLRPDTEFSVDEYEFDSRNADRNKSLFTLIKGGFRTLTGLISRLHPDGYKVKTAYAIVGVRGTTYETVIDSGLYAAAWQGTIYVENDKKLLELGFGQEFNYARVLSHTSAPAGLLEVPPQLQETIDPGLREAVVDPTLTRLTTGLLQDGADARLTAAETASLDRRGFAVFGGSTATNFVQGAASDGASGQPLFFDVSQDVVLRRGTPSGSDLTNPPAGAPFNIGGFSVSFGSWDAATSPAQVQPNATDSSLTLDVSTPVFWVAMPAPSSLPSGPVTYSFLGSQIASVGSGTGGPTVTVAGFNATLNFSTGALTNGQMQVQNASFNWFTQFTGTVTGPNFTANLSPTSTVGANTASGQIVGGVTGASAQGVGGVFDFRGSGGEFVNGSFIGCSSLPTC